MRGGVNWSRTRRFVNVVGFGGAVTLVTWAIGMALPFAIGLGCLAAALVAIIVGYDAGRATVWPPPFPEERFAASEVSRLSFSVRSEAGVVGGSSLGRIRALMDRMLEVEGIDPDDASQLPAIDAIFGPGVFAATRHKTIPIRTMEHILQTVHQRGQGSY